MLLLATTLSAQVILLPAPRGNQVDITRILVARHETAAFCTNGLTRQAVSDLLWASTGINRPATGNRTSNYAHSSRDNEIYLLCAQGVFLYDQLNHALTQQSTSDLRSTLPAPANTAPLTFALVTYSSSVDLFGAIHTGFISENIALACADFGLGAHLSADIPDSLSTNLGLAADHHLLILQTVGHPEGTAIFSSAWSMAAGPLAAASVSDTPSLKILKRRRSTRSFANTAFSDQTLGELLWAGTGINNETTLERTSPLVTGTNDIDIYVARSSGVFVYRPAFGAAHAIELVATNDIRGSFGDVPAIFVYVADYSKLTGTSAEKRRAASLHAGHISQNVAAYAAAEGVGEYVRSSIPVSASTLRLTTNQSVLFTQTLGYPGTSPGASTVSFVAAGGGSIVGSASQSIAFGSNCTPVVALPEAGRYFSYWSGLPGGRILSNPITLTDVTCPMTVTAVFSNEPYTYAGWASANFTAAELTNSSISGAEADPEHVGLRNFQRYGLNLAARGALTLPPAYGIKNVGEERFLTLTFNRRPIANDLFYCVEESSNLNDWTAFVTLLPGFPTNVTVQDSAAIGNPTNLPSHFLFLRLVSP